MPSRQRNAGGGPAVRLKSMVMRTAYRDQLNQFAHDILLMSDFVREALASSTHALLHGDLAEAERVMGSVENLEELRVKAEAAAFQLLALEAPVARDLREVVAGQHIVDDFARMGGLAVHIAKIARRRHPDIAVPEQLRPYVEEMGRLGCDAASKVKAILIDADVSRALEMIKDDDAVDDIHQHLYGLMTQRDWPYSTREAVDLTLLSRYFERFSDHAVHVGSRVIFIVTGLSPEEYTQQKEDEQAQENFRQQFDQLNRRYGGGID